MNREIKFRYFNGKSVLNQEAIINHLNKYIAKNDKNLMQYTGLKDRNGVEIYEGDIVKDEYDNELYFVWYSDTHARYVISPLAALKFNSQKRRVVDYGTGIKTYEVIGNIHENPELLNV